MNIERIAKELDLKVLSVLDTMSNTVTGGYTGDLLRDVMANSRERHVWITRQVHPNIVAVAT